MLYLCEEGWGAEGKNQDEKKTCLHHSYVCLEFFMILESSLERKIEKPRPRILGFRCLGPRLGP